MRGKRILSLRQIRWLALTKKAVVLPHGGRTPAAFVYQMPGQIIMQYIDSARGIYEYMKQEEKKP